MRTAKKIFEEELSGEPLTQESIIEAIKQAQIEAIDATVKMCAEKARLLNNGCNMDSDLYSIEARVAFFYDVDIEIDKQSILSCADKLKKEI